MKTVFNRNFILLLVLALIGFFLRFYRQPDFLFFGPEQGIDFMVMRDIVLNHKLTLIGAKTDVMGIFHGPLYYYLGAIPFLLSKGSPLFIDGFFIAINAFTVFLVYKVARDFFNEKIAWLSSIFYTISFGVVVYSHWLSTHPLSMPLTALFFIFFNKYLKGDNKSLLLSAVCLALIGQVAFLNYFFYGAIGLLLIIFFRKRFVKTPIIITLSSIVLLVLFAAGNYALFDLRHDFLMTKAILNLAQGNTGFHTSFAKSVVEAFRVFALQVSSFILPFWRLPAMAILIAGIYFLIQSYKKQRETTILMLLWIFTPLMTLLLTKHAALDQFFVTIAVPIIILTAYLIDSLWEKYRYISLFIFFIVVLSNLLMWVDSVPKNTNMFFKSPQPHLEFRDEKNIVHKTLEFSENKSYNFYAFTIPYWMKQGWEYLFWYYATQEHRLLPTENDPEKLFVILEQTPGGSDYTKYRNDWLKNTVPGYGKQQRVYKSGILGVIEIDPKIKQ